MFLTFWFFTGWFISNYSKAPSELSRSPDIRTSSYDQPKSQEFVPKYQETKEDYKLDPKNNETSVQNSEINDLQYSSGISPQKQHDVYDPSLKFSEKSGSFGGQNQYKFKQNEFFRNQSDCNEISTPFSSSSNFTKQQNLNNLPDISPRPTLQNDIEFHRNSAFEPIKSSKAANLSPFRKTDPMQITKSEKPDHIKIGQDNADVDLDTRNEAFSHTIANDATIDQNNISIMPGKDILREADHSTCIVKQEAGRTVVEDKINTKNHLIYRKQL